jgi:hypothetical protein
MKRALMVLVALQSCSMAMAQIDTEYTRKSLKDLVGIGVSVTPLTSYAIEDGLSKSQIQTDVELYLRMAGIKVLTDEEIISAPGMPTLDVRVIAMRGDGVSFYFISVGVMQGVMLKRDPQSGCGARTWSTENFITGKAINLQSLRHNLKVLVDNFINAYLSVNPK